MSPGPECSMEVCLGPEDVLTTCSGPKGAMHCVMVLRMPWTFRSGPVSVMAALPSPHGVTLVLGASWQFVLVLKVSQHCVHVFLVSHPYVLVLRMLWMCLLFPEGNMTLCTGAEDVMGVCSIP